MLTRRVVTIANAILDLPATVSTLLRVAKDVTILTNVLFLHHVTRTASVVTRSAVTSVHARKGTKWSPVQSQIAKISTNVELKDRATKTPPVIIQSELIHVHASKGTREMDNSVRISMNVRQLRVLGITIVTYWLLVTIQMLRIHAPVLQ